MPPLPSRTLPHARIAELPSPYFGKVRDCYDLPPDADHPDGRRILITTDRISAFDRILAVIPDKGAVLTGIARWWFDRTADIIGNHALAYPDPNAVVGRRLTILPVEIVVRGYLAGTTGTSILTMYQAGQRQMYGHGLAPNQALPRPIITPTSKAFDGGHDAPLTADAILSQGLLTPAQWEVVSTAALALFARGQATAAAQGLILADTKYEFGTTGDGTILLADEIHTPDSSRYWLADGYEAALRDGTRPPSFDKDVIRAWVAARCDPYGDPIPDIPPAMIAQTAQVYRDAYARIAGAPFLADDSHATVLDRLRANLAPYFTA
jgi:phosphoribosylaminoimidazole-succinocarboxamide synthase